MFIEKEGNRGFILPLGLEKYRSGKKKIEPMMNKSFNLNACKIMVQALFHTFIK